MEIYLKDESTRLRRISNLADLQVIFGPKYPHTNSDDGEEDEDENDDEIKDKEADKQKAWCALKNTWLAKAVSALCDERRVLPGSMTKQYADAISLAAQGKDLQMLQKLLGLQLLIRSVWNMACDPGNRNQAKISQTLSYIVVQEHLTIKQYQPTLFRGCAAACRLRTSLAVVLMEHQQPDVSVDTKTQRRIITPRKCVYPDAIKYNYHANTVTPSMTVDQIHTQLEQAILLGQQQKGIIRIVQIIENSPVAHLEDGKRETAVVASEVLRAVT